MDIQESGTPAQSDGVDLPTETVMQQYLYPGQWFDDLGAIVANTTPGMAWDLGTSSIARDDANNLITAYQEMGLNPYPGE